MDYEETLERLRAHLRTSDDRQALAQEHQTDWEAKEAKLKAQPPSVQRETELVLLALARANYIASQRQFDTEQSLMEAVTLIAHLGEAVKELRSRVDELERA